MSDFLDDLRFLADDPEDYLREGGSVVFSRHGIDHSLRVRQSPGTGPVVEHGGSLVPLPTYVQRNILDLPRVASQVSRVLDKAASQPRARPVAYIDGPAQYTCPDYAETWARVAEALLKLLLTPELGTTQLLQLMAPAGQGKTVLLEHLARELSRRYQPDLYPTPLLIPVDLLGRYVGQIDDAIAGSLNNRFFVPTLTQKDVLFCIRQHWLILALDGFDELVARVGARDAFSRLTELLDQLDSSGAVILSARESFFALYRITNAIRTYLQPKRGNYSTGAIELAPWRPAEGAEVFRCLGAPSPAGEFASLRRVFENDDTIVLHPFFLTRLASLWMQGERFPSERDATGGQRGRIKYVLDTFIERESGEKWVDRDGKPFLSVAEHVCMLGGIAEEMWRTNAFALDVEELRLAAEMSLDEMDVEHDKASAAVERIGTHAVFTPSGRGLGFLHESFFKYCFGCRIGALVAQKRVEDLVRLLEIRELDPEACHWCAWSLKRARVPARQVIGTLGQAAVASKTVAGKTNGGLLVGAVLAEGGIGEKVVIVGCVFAGGVLQGTTCNRCTFEDCKFWHADARGTVMKDCVVRGCEMSGVMLDDDTRFDGTKFHNSSFSAFEFSEGSGIYAPGDIAALISSKGGMCEAKPVGLTGRRESRVHQNALDCLDKMIRWSTKTCDVPTDQVEERYGGVGLGVIRLGLGNGILRSISRDASGRKKEFVRFCVDRSRLREAEVKSGAGKEIDAFWAAMALEFPLQNQ